MTLLNDSREITLPCRICEEPFRAPARSLLAVLKLCRDCYLVKAALAREVQLQNAERKMA